jgi:hypothetical protein
VKNIKLILLFTFVVSGTVIAQQSEEDKMNVAYDKYMEGEFHSAIQDFTQLSRIIRKMPRHFLSEEFAYLALDQNFLLLKTLQKHC